MVKKEAEEFLGTGRRKEAVARARVTRGTGKIIINNRKLENYCYTQELVRLAIAPLKTVEMVDQIDVRLLVHGGGSTGQAGAISHAISRALEKMDGELRSPLKKAGLLTRDSRMKERKKAGQPGARKNFQFSKR